MSLRNELIKLAEINTENEEIITILIASSFTEDEIAKELIRESNGVPYDESIKDTWINDVLNQFKEKIQQNNDFFGDISKHDIISSRQHFQDKNVELSNELYLLKKSFAQLDKDKRNLQMKLEKTRQCAECKEHVCINNIWHK